MVVTRFAPSPTGALHAGNIRTALVNWLLARKAEGRFLLRLDDTDRARSSEAAAQAIRADLAWLGLSADAEFRQSERFDRYDAALARLADQGRAYPAFETPEELELKRRVAQAAGRPPLYDRAALALSDADRARLAAEGRQPHWRFRLEETATIGWDDLVRGPCRFEAAALSDPVIRRADGSWLYLLPSVVDDIDMGITHIVRGEDHVSNSAVQLQMFEALGAPAPALAHLALLTGADAALSKRLGSEGVAQWQTRGIEPLAVLALLARLGTARPVEPVTSVAPLIAGFDLADFGRAPARFDPAELESLTARILHAMPHEQVASRLPGVAPAVWAAVRGNLGRLEDARDWQAIIEAEGGLARLPDDAALLATAADLAESLAWDAEVWSRLTSELKARTGLRGRALFLPLRLALTGRDHGPEMAGLLPLIGRDRAVARLRAAAQ